MARETWNDDQLDKAFDRVDADLRELRGEIRGLRSEMVKGFERVDAKFDSLQHNMLIGFIALFGSIVGSVVGGVLAALALA
jgi:hypothetical protein